MISYDGDNIEDWLDVLESEYPNWWLEHLGQVRLPINEYGQEWELQSPAWVVSLQSKKGGLMIGKGHTPSQAFVFAFELVKSLEEKNGNGKNI